MHRFRSWLLDPPEYRTQRNRLLPIEGGDGSTFNLDFTTGVLDPRLSFSRTSNATFINSNGLVEWATVNMAGAANLNSTTSFNCYNTGASPNMETPTLVSGPNGIENTASSFTLTANGFIDARFGTVSITGTIPGFSIGLTYTLSYYFKATRAGSPITSVGMRVSPAGSGYQTVTNIVDVAAGNGFTYRTCQFVATATSYGFVWAYGNFNSGDILVSSTIQVEPGTIARSYIPTSGGQYYGPRFDFDQVAIGTPRGLLIEGQSINFINNSNNIYTGSWGGSVGITATQDTTILDPSGGTTTCKIVKSSPNQYVVRNQPIPTLTVPANSTVHLTISVWLRMDGANQVAASLGIYDTAGASFGTRSGASVSNSAVTISSGSSADAEFTFGTVTGWVRCSISRSFTNATASPVSFSALQFYIYPNRLNTNATTIYAWGAQAETGIGPSSLIPTGSGQGTRTTDNCTIGVNAGTETNFSSWWPLNQAAWTIQWTGDFVRNTTTVQFLWLTRTSGGSSVMRVFGNSTTGQPLNGFSGNTVSPVSTVNAIPGAFIRTAFANQEGDQAFYANNGIVSSSGTAANTSIPTTSANMNFNPNSDQFMHIKTLKFWPIRLSNTTLQGLVS